MLPASSSAQNLHSAGQTLQPPPRSRSNLNLAASAASSSSHIHNNNSSSSSNAINNTGGQTANSNARTSPTFLRSSSTGVTHLSHVPPHGLARSASDMPPSPSLRMRPSSSHAQTQGFHHLQPRSASGSHTPTQPTFSHNPPPPLPHSASASHFGVYDSRLVANTINKIETSSSAGTLVNAASGSASGTTAAPPGSSHGPENDAWTAACIRTLPLFNGEGQRGYIEDLNDLVSAHIKRTTDRLGKNVNTLNALASDLTDLLAMGMLTLNAKLVDLSDERLLVRITEVWNFFFIGCLPYIEGIFLPLRTDSVLRSIVGSAGHTAGGRSMSFNSSTIRDNVEAIDIRRTALRAFRDHLVLPIVDRLAILFSEEPRLSAAHPAEPSSKPGSTNNVSSTTRTASARRLQMVSILIGVQTNDERQNATEALGKALRAGMEKQQADYAADAVPTSFGTGLYGAAIHSHAARARSESGPEADRRSWRRARQAGNHTPSRDASVHSKGRNESLDPGVDGRSDYGSRTSERVRRHTTDGESERRYLDNLRRNEQGDMPIPAFTYAQPEAAAVH